MPVNKFISVHGQNCAHLAQSFGCARHSLGQAWLCARLHENSRHGEYSSELELCSFGLTKPFIGVFVIIHYPMAIVAELPPIFMVVNI